jgi:hypothetical protein
MAIFTPILIIQTANWLVELSKPVQLDSGEWWSPFRLALHQDQYILKLALGFILGIVWAIVVESIFEVEVRIEQEGRRWSFVAVVLVIIHSGLFLVVLWSEVIALDAFLQFTRDARPKPALPFLISFIGTALPAWGALLLARFKVLYQYL